MVLKRITKRLLSLWLTVVIIAGTVSVASFTAFAKAVTVKTETELVNAVNKGGEIQLKDNIDLTDALGVPSGVTVTLDLNGFTLSRSLDECIDNGSVISVEPDATLTIIDCSDYNTGTITGGAAFFGGGIFNNGTLYLKGGTIINNEAQKGGGVFNGVNGTLVIEKNEFTKKVGLVQKSFVTNVSVTNNTAEKDGGGIYSDGAIKISGAFEIYDNDSCDIYLAKDKKLTVTGELQNTNRISVMTKDASNSVITEDYSKYNTKKPSELFVSADTKAVMMFSSAENGEVMLKTDNKTVIQVYESGKIVKRSRSM